MELVARQDALERGLSRYFTGGPCKHGHVSERFTKSWKCVECHKLSEKKPARRERKYANAAIYRSENSEKISEGKRRWQAENPEKFKAGIRRWRQANPDKMNASQRRRYAADPERYRARQQQWKAENRGDVNAAAKRYYDANVEKILAARSERADRINEYGREWKRKNKHRVRGYCARRYMARKRATPPWADLDAIAAIYRQAYEIEARTNVPHHVDHIIPLQHERVCGLHVPWNLQVITAEQNRRKSNRIED